jgi:hypothetical protein
MFRHASRWDGWDVLADVNELGFVRGRRLCVCYYWCGQADLDSDFVCVGMMVRASQFEPLVQAVCVCAHHLDPHSCFSHVWFV